MACFDSSHGRIAYADTSTGTEILIFMHGLCKAAERKVRVDDNPVEF